MNDSHSSSSDSASMAAIDQNVGRSRRSGSGDQTLATDIPRHWHDIFWLGVFLFHLMGLALALAVLGLNRFTKSDRFNFDRYTSNTTITVENGHGLTEDYWPMYGLGGGVGTLLGWSWDSTWVGLVVAAWFAGESYDEDLGAYFDYLSCRG